MSDTFADTAAELGVELTPCERVLDWASRHNVTMRAQFVPFSHSRNKAEKHKSLNWVVTLARGGRDFLITDYSAGRGHCPAQTSKPPSRWPYSATDWRPRASDWECEHGYRADWSTYNGDFERWRGGAMSRTKEQPIKPDLCDVLYSLSSDTSVLDAGGFENWAEYFGYDSRTAEATYKACIDIALKLRGAVGDTGMRELAEVCQDY